MSDKTNHGHRQAGDRRSVRTALTAQGGELVAEVTRRRRAELDRLLKVLPRLEPDPARRTRIRSVNNFDPNGPWWHRPGYRASRSAGVGRTTLIALLFGRYSAPQRRGPAGPGTPAGDSSAVTENPGVTEPGVSASQFSPRTVWARRLEPPLGRFLRTETGGAAVLLAPTLVALAWANIDPSGYAATWQRQRVPRVSATISSRTRASSGPVSAESSSARWSRCHWHSSRPATSLSPSGAEARAALIA
jgi:hypothetical protein